MMIIMGIPRKDEFPYVSKSDFIVRESACFVQGQLRVGLMVSCSFHYFLYSYVFSSKQTLVDIIDAYYLVS